MLKNDLYGFLKWDKHSPLQGWNIGRTVSLPFIAATAHSLWCNTPNTDSYLKSAAQVEPLRMIGISSVYAQQHRTPTWIIRKKDLYSGAIMVA
ncbi:hypothetical protein OK016_29640 [Vibrio chagasii]|nr:hypothetical protein [Vibrio chagasii]